MCHSGPSTTMLLKMPPKPRVPASCRRFDASGEPLLGCFSPRIGLLWSMDHTGNDIDVDVAALPRAG